MRICLLAAPAILVGCATAPRAEPPVVTAEIGLVGASVDAGAAAPSEEHPSGDSLVATTNMDELVARVIAQANEATPDRGDDPAPTGEGVEAAFVTVTEGEVEGDALAARFLPHLERCYLHARSLDPKLAGKVTLKAELRHDGTVERVVAERWNGVSAPLVGCAMSVVSGGRFVVKKGTPHISFGLVFTKN